MSSRKLLKLNWNPESIPTAWGLCFQANFEPSTVPNAYGLQTGKKQWTSNNTILIVFVILAIIVLANIPNWIKIHNYLNDEEGSG